MKDELETIDTLRLHKWILGIELECAEDRLRWARFMFFCHHGKFPDEV